LKPKPEAKLAQFLDVLTIREQQIICGVLRSYPEYSQLHLGLLPFVSVDRVLLAFNGIKTTRIRAQIIAKLPIRAGWRKPHTIWLRDSKVYRYFGKRPEQGRALRWLPGNAVVALKRVKKHNDGSTWEVHCEAKYAEAVELWLMDQCS
jgi:hypothetical protein